MSALDSPAFPHEPYSVDARRWSDGSSGMTTRQYAAIKLRVPMSGDADLDAMILESRRLDFAGQALAGLLVNGGASFWDRDAEHAYAAANAMIEAQKGGAK